MSPGFVPLCIPTRAARPPTAPDWIHEIKHDGYRLLTRPRLQLDRTTDGTFTSTIPQK
jgi:hypothetical protein